LDEDKGEGSLDELDGYLLTPRNLSIQDPIQYWHAILPSSLARMALDLLTAPGKCHIFSLVCRYEHTITASSVDAERSFSSGGLTVSKHRYSLTDESVRAVTVLASWSRADINSLLPESQLLAHINAKAKRPKKSKGVELLDNHLDSSSDSDAVL